MSWSITTFDKSERGGGGGLGIRNLKLVRSAMMTENILTFLNNKELLKLN